MKQFNRLLPAFGIRLFLFVFLVGAILSLSPISAFAQFKFRDPANRQDPAALGELEGMRMWRLFLDARDIGSFKLQGELVYRQEGKRSRSFDYVLEGDWTLGKQHTHLKVYSADGVIVDTEIRTVAGETRVADRMDPCGVWSVVDAAFWEIRLHPDLPLSWADLLMPYLLWKPVSYIGPSRYMGRPAHLFEMSNPRLDAFPRRVVVTLDEDFLALLKADLYANAKAPARRLRIGGFRQYNDVWMFSELNWENRQSRESIRLKVDDFIIHP